MRRQPCHAGRHCCNPWWQAWLLACLLLIADVVQGTRGLHSAGPLSGASREQPARSLPAGSAASQAELGADAVSTVARLAESGRTAFNSSNAEQRLLDLLASAAAAAGGSLPADSADRGQAHTSSPADAQAVSWLAAVAAESARAGSSAQALGDQATLAGATPASQQEQEGRTGGQAGAAGYTAAHRTMAELVEAEGYPLEAYSVETADGYLLGLYRIPRGAGGAGAPGTRRPAVLLQHALLDCSASWVNNGAAASLAFILADAGWDVWLGNSRGNTFSRAHVSYAPTDARFWDFSWDEMAALDLPALVAHVLRATGHTRLSYVGHSQGTTMAFAALASQPALAAQVDLAVMLAPVTFLGHISSAPVVALAALQTDEVFELMGSLEFMPASEAVGQALGRLCARAPAVCLLGIAAICGAGGGNLNATRLPLYLSYTPAGTSVRNMAHWAQGVRGSWSARAPRFQAFDYGAACTTPLGLPRRCNANVYGAPQPPEYNLSAISTKLAVFTGGRDRLSDGDDARELTRGLAPGVLVALHDEPGYGHLDFCWGQDAHVRIYPAVLQLLQRYGNASTRPCR